MLHKTDRASIIHSAARTNRLGQQQEKLSELTAAAASGGAKVAAALRLLEDLELGLGPSQVHIN
jgi:hypothetical protein